MSTVAEMSVGDRGRVAHVAGDDDISLRLLEMGLTPGADISLRGTAPFGDPIEIELRGYRLSLRRNEAARIEIEPSP